MKTIEFYDGFISGIEETLKASGEWKDTVSFHLFRSINDQIICVAYVKDKLKKEEGTGGETLTSYVFMNDSINISTEFIKSGDGYLRVLSNFVLDTHEVAVNDRDLKFEQK